MTNYTVDPKKTEAQMTQYKIELYNKGERKPYDSFMATLTHGFHPRYTATQECFGGKLERPYKAKVYYASNGGLVAIKTYDRKHGYGRLTWVRMK